ncbi:MAG: chromosomal replication initiator protein DnaA [Syntrophomonadaceae bacterium]|nr:chromosomal replication initiator protein DnaA [Syntrophomonadaceae bacterium]
MSIDYDFPAIWQKVLDSIAKEIDQASYDAFLSTATYKTFHNNTLYVSVPHTSTQEWIKIRYLDRMTNELRHMTNQDINLFLTTDNTTAKEDFSGLNRKYTFDTFVIGNSNRFAHAACYAVGESPARAYNPLFIYGGVGLGKTHLMQAIGHQIIAKRPDCVVVYVSSEQFTNELISSFKDDTTAAFRNKYRNIDVLLVDDIQFLAGKDRTQEEFFHTFNTLYENNKQVVLSSDRPPRHISKLEDRLRSRFEWGLITDIQPPDLETRIAILRKKAEAEKINIPYDILDYIANCIDSNIRELEGALVRLVAYATITNKELNMATAVEALKEILPEPVVRGITVEYIQKTVAEYFGIGMNELLSKKRNKQLVYPRQIAMYLCRRMTDASFPQIGQQFGGRDHTTAIYSIEKMEKDLATDNELSKIVETLSRKIDPNFVI